MLRDTANGIDLSEIREGRFNKSELSLVEFQLSIARVNSGL